MTETIALLPGLSILGPAVPIVAPGVGSVVPFQVPRRTADLAIARPTWEVLSTLLGREGAATGVWLAVSNDMQDRLVAECERVPGVRRPA